MMCWCSQAVDWWSLGALAHEMLIGKPPFKSRNTADLQKKILTAKVLCKRSVVATGFTRR